MQMCCRLQMVHSFVHCKTVPCFSAQKKACDLLYGFSEEVETYPGIFTAKQHDYIVHLCIWTILASRQSKTLKQHPNIANVMTNCRLDFYLIIGIYHSNRETNSLYNSQSLLV